LVKSLQKRSHFFRIGKPKATDNRGTSRPSTPPGATNVGSLRRQTAGAIHKFSRGRPTSARARRQPPGGRSPERKEHGARAALAGLIPARCACAPSDPLPCRGRRVAVPFSSHSRPRLPRRIRSRWGAPGITRRHYHCAAGATRGAEPRPPCAAANTARRAPADRTRRSFNAATCRPSRLGTWRSLPERALPHWHAWQPTPPVRRGWSACRQHARCGPGRMARPLCPVAAVPYVAVQGTDTPGAPRVHLLAWLLCQRPHPAT
jgi:hypothetical protein